MSAPAPGPGSLSHQLSMTKFYADPNSENYLSTPLVPIGVSLVMAWGIADLFFNVYEMARGGLRAVTRRMCLFVYV